MNTVIGIDEVGRGAWAGPLLVVAARQITTLPAGLVDSKKTTKSQRLLLKSQLDQACQFEEGWVTASEIDNLGLAVAMKLGVSRALEAIDADKLDEIIIDGHINYCPNDYVNSKWVIRADDTIPIVSAASIYAKVVRDQYMATLDSRLPLYEFINHVGYGTKKHIKAIERHGVTDYHRMSYKPIRRLINAAN